MQTPSTNQMTGDRQTDTHTQLTATETRQQRRSYVRSGQDSVQKSNSAHKHRLLESVWRKAVTGGHREKSMNTAQLLHCPCLSLACIYPVPGFSIQTLLS